MIDIKDAVMQALVVIMRILIQQALSMRCRGRVQAGVEGFLEELIVRRELSDNFCHYGAHLATAQPKHLTPLNALRAMCAPLAAVNRFIGSDISADIAQ